MNEAQRTELTRAIAESDIAGCSLENRDIDALVDLVEAWLERQALPAQVRAAAEEIEQTCISPLHHDADYQTATGKMIVREHVASIIFRHLVSPPAEQMKKAKCVKCGHVHTLPMMYFVCVCDCECEFQSVEVK